MNRLEIALTIVLAVVVTAAAPLIAETPQPTVAAEQTYLLSCSGNDAAIKLKVVERSEVNQSRYVDLVGLRLWVDNAESQRRIPTRIADPAAARRLVTEQLDAKLRETGVEPDTIPVRGEEGKRMGIDG